MVDGIATATEVSTVGIAYAILGPIADANVDVDMIIQNASVDAMTDFSFTVPRNDYSRAIDISRMVQSHIGAKDIVGDNRVCKVSLVGVGMRGLACCTVHPTAGDHAAGSATGLDHPE